MDVDEVETGPKKLNLAEIRERLLRKKRQRGSRIMKV